MPNDSTPSGFPGLTIAGKRYITVERWSRRRSVRASVLFLFVLISGIQLAVRSNTSHLLWEASLVSTLLFILWPIAQGTYLLHKNRTMSLHARYTAANNLKLEEFPIHHASALRQLGFQFAGCLEKQPNDPRVTTRVALFVHEENGDSAQLALVRSSLRTVHLLVFATRFRSGLVLETSNYFRMPLFRPKPKFPSFRFPQLRSVSCLYLLHRALAKEYEQTRTKLRETSEDALTNFIEAAEEIHLLNMEQGDYKLNDSGDHYLLTWRGALRQSFFHAWPMSTIRSIRAHAAAEKTCKRLGYRINPKLGRIEPFKEAQPSG